MIPVDNWAMFAEKGGIKGQVDWIPIDQVVNAIDHLRQYRQDKVVQIYEVLGVSDIMRGSSKASETAAAQQIKAQFGSTRIQLKQFCRFDGGGELRDALPAIRIMLVRFRHLL